MNQRDVYLCASWPDSVFDRLRDFRRDAARQEALEGCRPVKKFYQRRVKAATILLQYFEGTGPFSDGVPKDAFPNELHADMWVLMNNATQHVMVT